MPTRRKLGRQIVTLVAQSKDEGRRSPALVADKPAPRLGGILRSVLHAAEQLLGANDRRTRAAAKKRVRRRKARLATRIGEQGASRVVEAFTGDAGSAVAVLAAAGTEARPFLEGALVKLGKLVDEFGLDDVGALTEATGWAIQSGFATYHSAQAARSGDDKWFRMARESTERASLCLERCRQLQKAANDAREQRATRERLAEFAQSLKPPTTPIGDREPVRGDGYEPDDRESEPPSDARPSDEPDEPQVDAEPLARPAPGNAPQSYPPPTTAAPPGGFVDLQGNDSWGQHVATRSAVDPEFAERTIHEGNARSAKLITEYERFEALRKAQHSTSEPPSYVPAPRTVEEALAAICVRPPLVRP